MSVDWALEGLDENVSYHHQVSVLTTQATLFNRLRHRSRDPDSSERRSDIISLEIVVSRNTVPSEGPKAFLTMTKYSGDTARSIIRPTRVASVNEVSKPTSPPLNSSLACEPSKNTGELARRLRRMKRKLFLSHVNENDQLRLMRTFSESSASIQLYTSQSSFENRARCPPLVVTFEEEDVSDLE